MGEVKFKQEYLCTFESNIEFLTISEIEDRYRVKIDTSQIGFDTGVCFNTIALKLDGWRGIYKIVSYLPNGKIPKREYDLIIQIKK